LVLHPFKSSWSPDLHPAWQDGARPQGGCAPLRGGLRPSLTTEPRLAHGKAGRDGGMVSSIKQRDE
jgi:hypothetical protein